MNFTPEEKRMLLDAFHSGHSHCFIFYGLHVESEDRAICLYDFAKEILESEDAENGRAK